MTLVSRSMKYGVRRVGELLGWTVPDRAVPEPRPDELILGIPAYGIDDSVPLEAGNLRQTKVPMSQIDLMAASGSKARTGYYGILIPDFRGLPMQRKSTMEVMRMVDRMYPGYFPCPLLVSLLMIAVELLDTGDSSIGDNLVRSIEQAPRGAAADYQLLYLGRDNTIILNTSAEPWTDAYTQLMPICRYIGP